MRARVTAATAALLLAALTACGSSSDGVDAKPAKSKTSTSKSSKDKTGEVDCMDESISQADWMEYCAGTGGDGTDGQLTGLKFGESYTWPDGLKVSVIEARKWTKFTEEDFSSDEPDVTEFRVLLKLENTGKTAVELDELSTFIDGATNGGEASTTEFATASEPLGGRLAPGVTVTKTDDNGLEAKYGKKIVVTVQRAGDTDVIYDFPEFEGEIVG